MTPLTRRQRMYGLSADALIVHCPLPQRVAENPFHVDWERACELFFADDATRGRFACPAELTIVTYSNYDTELLLERCLSHIGVERYLVLGQGIERFEWIHKVSLVHEAIESGAIATDYVLCLDGDDVLVLGDPADALSRFRSTGCRVLFCGTRGDQPASPECWEFENSVEEYRDPLHRHLNAGAYLGQTAYVGERLGEIVAAHERSEPWCFSQFGFDDQLAWRHLHRRHYPDIKVDAGCRVFLRFDEDR